MVAVIGVLTRYPVNKPRVCSVEMASQLTRAVLFCTCTFSLVG